MITSCVFTVLLIRFRLKREKQLTLSLASHLSTSSVGSEQPHSPGSRRPIRRSFCLCLLPHFRDQPLAVADEDLAPWYKPHFLHSPCKWLLMHLKQQMLPRAGEPRLCRSSMLSRGLSPGTGRRHHSSFSPTAAAKMFFIHDSKDFLYHLVMLFLGTNTLPPVHHPCDTREHSKA